MAHVEIYKLRKTVPPDVRDYSLFDFMARGKAPDPVHYVKEWAGEMHGTLPLTIPGRLMLEPPKDYHGGDIRNGDIAVVDGEPFYFDRLQGSKFVEMDFFDTDGIRQAVHVKYGWTVDITDAIAISNTAAYICEDIGIPCGYLGAAGSGVYNGSRAFLPGAGSESNLNFLHPQFMQGDEAEAFIDLLMELPDAERWTRIFDYLHERTPLTIQDLQDAQEHFAPELLLPEELRPLHKLIPEGTDKAELDYLAVKIRNMDEGQRKTFDAVLGAGWYDGSAAEIINMAENLDCFDIEEAAVNESVYGAFRLEHDYEVCEATIQRLEKSDDAGDRFLAKYITLLNRCAEEERYGYHAAKEDGGVFTKHGYLTQARDIEIIYRGVQDIPAENRKTETPSTPSTVVSVEATEESKPLMVHNTDLASLLLEMHASGGDYMRDAQYNLKSLANKGDDFLIRMHPEMLIVTPADFVYRRDMEEHQSWMLLTDSPDIRTFVMSVTAREDGRIIGNLCETDLYSLKDSIRENSFFFTHIDAEMKDGTSKRFTLDEWDAMDCYERGQLKSWVKHYDPADESRLTAFISALRWALEDNRQPVTVGELLSKINTQYMERADNPQPCMLRAAPDAAKEILAQSAADVFRLMPGDMEKLSPIDAIKVPVYQSFREFAVKPHDVPGIEKWAQRASGDMLRQMERGERNKSKSNPEL